MNPSNGNDSSADLSGILLVEDSWHLGKALKGLLQDCGAEVVVPDVTSADAQRLASEQPPDAALVDFSLRNERTDLLIDRLNEHGIYVIVMLGHNVLPVAARRAAAILQKPFNAATPLSSLRPVVARKKVAERTVDPRLIWQVDTTHRPLGRHFPALRG